MRAGHHLSVPEPPGHPEATTLVDLAPESAERAWGAHCKTPHSHEHTQHSNACVPNVFLKGPNLNPTSKSPPPKGQAAQERGCHPKTPPGGHLAPGTFSAPQCGQRSRSLSVGRSNKQGPLSTPAPGTTLHLRWGSPRVGSVPGTPGTGISTVPHPP